ncbi:MAG: DNA recombination protein RmuC [Fibrobacter sp.]|uniref:DNA recombination protein RmuC n=1 Tax=Fibrobacter sp. TaxID=35828 RepID=UPI002A90DB1F|nr:DNA recombination protein RmuC [Fibrobacter sp.]MDY6263390.1 DNA recombination protein RmuC [Fibrobacter sp.]
MELFLAFIVGLIVAGAVAFIIAKKKQGSAESVETQIREKVLAETQVERLKAESDLKTTVARLTADKEHLQNDVESLKNDKRNADQRANELNDENTRLQADLKGVQERLEAQLAHEQQEAENRDQREERAKKDREAQFAEQINLLKSTFEATSQKLLKERSDDLKGVNKEQMDNITKPFFKEMEELRKMIGETKTGTDKTITELGATIKTVMERSEQMSKDTQNLAEALKNRGKVQGDWGEQVLENILRDSGLRENVEYTAQYNTKDDERKDKRPDIVVHCADGTKIVIDSKVSLTAYTDYIGAENEEDRKAAIKANHESIWNHVKELADKDYSKLVPGSMPMVLMFVPNEGSYILALNHDPQIGQKAFSKNVLIINPTNLMLALKLILQTWRNTRQEESCQKIIDAAKKIYEKYCSFTDSMNEVGEQLSRAQKSYDKAVGQMKEGRGNLSGCINGLIELGVQSPKKINDKMLPPSER